MGKDVLIISKATEGKFIHVSYICQAIVSLGDGSSTGA